MSISFVSLIIRTTGQQCLRFISLQKVPIASLLHWGLKFLTLKQFWQFSFWSYATDILTYDIAQLFLQGASSLRRSEGGPRLNRLWVSSAPGAGKGLFRPRTHASSPHKHKYLLYYQTVHKLWLSHLSKFYP